MPTTIVDTLLELQELYGLELVELSLQSAQPGQPPDHYHLECKLPLQSKG
jgi:hypothetical protein